MKKVGLFVSLVLSVFILAACGSSDSNPAPAVGTFSLGYISDNAGDAETGVYEADFAAGGVFDFSTTVTSGTPDSGSGFYVNNGDGSLNVDGGMDFHISGNGELMGAIDTGSGTEAILVGARQGSGLSMSTLIGEYAVYVFGAEGVGSYTVVSDASFDGSGNVSFSNISISDGSMGTDFGPVSYTVSPSGLLTIPDTAVNFTGQVSTSGQVVIAVDPETSNSTSVEFAVMVKKTTAGTAPLGTFLALQYMEENVGGGSRIANAAIVTFGAVDGFGEGLLDYQDVINPADSQTGVPFNYDSASGVLTVEVDPAPVYEVGRVSPGGTAFVICDNDDGGGSDSIHVMVGMKM